MARFRFSCLLTSLALVAGGSSNDFPSIKTLAKSDASDFSIPQPSLDLDPTSLSENAPMIMSLPDDLQSNLEETDFSKNFPMDFSITQPQLDLVPSFTIHDEEGKDVLETPKEETHNPKNEEAKTSDVIPAVKQVKRSKREASEHPSIFDLMSAESNFQIKFPTPDLTPGMAIFGLGGHRREARQLRRHPFSFRPSHKLTGSFRPQEHRVTFNDLEEFRAPASRPARQGPVYPPFDPFNTTYIPLPGPSSPHYALKLQHDNPHMSEKARFVRFRRPIRQSRFLSQRTGVLPEMYQDKSLKANSEAVTDPFKYKSTREFEKSSQAFKEFLFNSP